MGEQDRLALRHRIAQLEGERLGWKTRAELAAKALLASREPITDTYACQRCGRRDGLDAVAPNAIWAQITEGTLTPSGEVIDGRWNLLCLWCMDEIATAKGIRCSVSLHFAGVAITGGSQSDADREHIWRLAGQRDLLCEEVTRLRNAMQDAVRCPELCRVCRTNLRGALHQQPGRVST